MSFLKTGLIHCKYLSVSGHFAPFSETLVPWPGLPECPQLAATVPLLGPVPPPGHSATGPCSVHLCWRL